MPFYVQSAIVLGILFFIFIFTESFNLIGILPIFEWVTRYILPWIALYWFIEFVKNKRVKT
ncbi:hypothetical protein [Virgibacillus sp. JSM 102003]|uniref:hypothetical protein n=1 Tax=Virgibacillus sp. JSM 102003 TaxID=1562108 RepID=UPI0035BFD162